MADYVENFCEATNILVEKQLESLSFDTTIEATVIDASKASSGRYIVSTGSASFEAYSTETRYKENDAVMVTVPQGDYNKQKNIVGKQVDDTNTPIIYKSPFSELINISNNLISGEHEISIWANSGDQYGWNENEKTFLDSKAYNKVKQAFLERDAANSDNIHDNDIDDVKLRDMLKDTSLIWDSNDEGKLFEARFTRIGLKASFSTWLNEYNTTSGNYGLALLLIFSNLDNSGSFSKVVTFDSDEFFGDVYNFETFYNQSVLFDISDYVDYPIRRILLFAYQRNNFKDINGEKIYEESDLEGISTISPNIFIKDLYVCLGMPTSDFNADQAVILTDSNSTYQKVLSSEDLENITENILIEKNKTISQEDEKFTEVQGTEGAFRLKRNEKILGLRWVHKDADSGDIATVLPNELPSGYHIFWYRYKIGAPSPDNFAGAHWERFYGGKKSYESSEESKKILLNQPFIDPNEEYNITAEEYNSNNSIDIATDQIDNIPFYPNINRETEQIKAIIVKEENNLEGIVQQNKDGKILRMVAQSEILEFTNQNEVRNKITFIDENALSIRFDDETGGNYFIYNRAGQITSEEYYKTLKTLTAVFDDKENDVYKKGVLTQPYTSIKWSFPAENTMIIPATTANPELADQLTNPQISFPDGVSFNDIEKTYEFTYNREEGDKTDSSLISVGYFIKPNLNYNASNNTIRLEINKDGQVYVASVSLKFGSAGTSGSDYTIALEWLNDSTGAFDVNSEEGLWGQVKLLDSELKEVYLEEPSKYEFSWYKVKTDKDNANISQKEELRDLYYPVKNNVLLELYEKNNAGDSYFVTHSSNDNLEYFYYNLETKKYELLKKENGELDYNHNRILYRKLKSNEIKKSVYYFQEIDLSKTDYDMGLSNAKRAFVKYNDIYIVDPWEGFQENETYYELVQGVEKKYIDVPLKIIPSTEKPSQFKIQKRENNFSENILKTDLYILEIKLTHFGDYDLIARYPIPLKNSGTLDNYGNKKYVVKFIEGATDVRYSVSGETDFNKGIYKINLQLLTQNGDDLSYFTTSQGFDNEAYHVFGHWELIYDEEKNENSSFLPGLDQPDDFEFEQFIDALNNSYVRYKTDPTNNHVYFEIKDTFVGDGGMTTSIRLIFSLLKKSDVKNLSNDKKISKIIDLFKTEYKEDLISLWNLLVAEQNNINFNEDLEDLKNILYETNKSVYKNFKQILISKNILNNKKLYLIKPILKPPGIYFEDTPLYGVQFITHEPVKDDKNNIIKDNGGNPIIPANTVLWTQPIYVYQDNYPSTTLNKWNGKDILTNEDEGTLSANGFSAGKKEKDNTFSGVVLGDWSRTDTDTAVAKQTGVYGFHKGIMSYALKEDGTAFFGKEGKGRIYLNGKKAQIYSSSWITPILKEAGKYVQAEKGMLIDIDDGYIKINDPNGQEESKSEIKITGQTNETLIKPGYFKLMINNGNTLLEINPSKYYLKSADFHDATYKKTTDTSLNSEKIYYTLNNNRYTLVNSPSENNLANYYEEEIPGAGVEFDLENGRLIGYKFKIEAGVGNNKLIINSDNSEVPLKINGSNFYVKWDGFLHSINGNIGGWSVGPDSITNNSSPYAKGATITSGIGLIKNVSREGDYNKNHSIFFAGSRTTNNDISKPFKFQVRSDGKLYAKEVDIEGKINATNGNIGDWVIKEGRIQSQDTNPNIILKAPNNSDNEAAIKLGIFQHNNNNYYHIVLKGDGSMSIKDSNTNKVFEFTTSDGLSVNRGKIGKIIIDEDGAIYNGNNFKVSKDGDLTAKSGNIGGWDITGSKIKNGNIELIGGNNGSITATGSGATTTIGNNGKLTASGASISGDVTITSGSIIIKDGNTEKFKVTSSGNVTAKNLTAEGTVSIKAGDVHIKNTGEAITFNYQTGAQTDYTKTETCYFYIGAKDNAAFGIADTSNYVYMKKGYSADFTVHNDLSVKGDLTCNNMIKTGNLTCTGNLICNNIIKTGQIWIYYNNAYREVKVSTINNVEYLTLT